VRPYAIETDAIETDAIETDGLTKVFRSGFSGSEPAAVDDIFLRVPVGSRPKISAP
jgi:hypothetical protein